MSWTWNQSTGEMAAPNGEIIGIGYAGRGPGLNNPAMQDAPCVGPLPCNEYIIGPLLPSHGALGANVAYLSPVGTGDMHGRGRFFIHGRKSPTDMDASEGCIVLDHDVRLKVIGEQNRDRDLLVISGWQPPPDMAA